MTTELRKVIIVGGGSAGWMTAATLLRAEVPAEVVVIESPDIPTVGVGESTLGQFKLWTRWLGIDESEFIPATDASFKMSIKFTDFHGKGTGGFHYPFGTPAIERGTYEPNDWFVSDAYCSEANPTYAQSFFPAIALAERNRVSPTIGEALAPYDFRADVAYHFNAVLFGKWLRERYCKPRGAGHIEATVKGCRKGPEGIEALILDDGSEMAADLYVDCTGWKSMLLGGELGEVFRPYDHMIPNNRAWTARVPYTDKRSQMEPFTNCTAIENGWVWNTPLWSQIGSGYVYSDRFISRDEARIEFQEHLRRTGVSNPEELSYRELEMRIGIHERTWVKNVVAIGLSAGFIEPLESNGLLTIHEFALYLAETLHKGFVNQWDRDVYNTRAKALFDDFASFVAYHYALSRRKDTEYWREVTERARLDVDYLGACPSETASYVSYAESRLLTRRWNEFAGGVCVFAGLGHNHLPKPLLELESVRQGLDYKDLGARAAKYAAARYSKWVAEAEKAPTAFDFLSSYYTR